MENQTSIVSQNNSWEIDPSFNYEKKTSNIKLVDIVERVESCDKISFEISNDIFMNLKISFNGLESKQIETNHYELFEFVYYITNEILKSSHSNNPEEPNRLFQNPQNLLRVKSQ